MDWNCGEHTASSRWAGLMPRWVTWNVESSRCNAASHCTNRWDRSFVCRIFSDFWPINSLKRGALRRVWSRSERQLQSLTILARDSCCLNFIELMENCLYRSDSAMGLRQTRSPPEAPVRWRRHSPVSPKPWRLQQSSMPPHWSRKSSRVWSVLSKKLLPEKLGNTLGNNL